MSGRREQRNVLSARESDMWLDQQGGEGVAQIVDAHVRDGGHFTSLRLRKHLAWPLLEVGGILISLTSLDRAICPHTPKLQEFSIPEPSATQTMLTNNKIGTENTHSKARTYSCGVKHRSPRLWRELAQREAFWCLGRSNRSSGKPA